MKWPGRPENPKNQGNLPARHPHKHKTRAEDVFIVCWRPQCFANEFVWESEKRLKSRNVWTLVCFKHWNTTLLALKSRCVWSSLCSSVQLGWKILFCPFSFLTTCVNNYIFVSYVAHNLVLCWKFFFSFWVWFDLKSQNAVYIISPVFTSKRFSGTSAYWRRFNLNMSSCIWFYFPVHVRSLMKEMM